MRNSLVRLFGAFALVFAVGATPALAQTGTLSGRVLDAETGAVLSGVQVQVLGAGDAASAGALTNAQGQYRIQVASGTYSVVARDIGYQQNRIDGVSVSGGGTTTLDFEMTSTQFQLNPIVVTASRRQEKAYSTPTHLRC